MKIVIDNSCSTNRDIYIYATSVDIEVTADLKANKIDIIGRNVIVHSKLEALTEFSVVGLDHTNFTPTSAIILGDNCIKHTIGSATLNPLYMTGIHISNSLIDRVSFVL
jgi:hypothetical protein